MRSPHLPLYALRQIIQLRWWIRRRRRLLGIPRLPAAPIMMNRYSLMELMWRRWPSKPTHFYWTPISLTTINNPMKTMDIFSLRKPFTNLPIVIIAWKCSGVSLDKDIIAKVTKPDGINQTCIAFSSVQFYLSRSLSEACHLAMLKHCTHSDQSELTRCLWSSLSNVDRTTVRCHQ